MGGYVYKVSQEEIEHNAKQGCRWCDLMCRWGSSSMRKPSVTKSENIVEISVGYSDHSKTCLRVTVNERICWFGYVYTTEGAHTYGLVLSESSHRSALDAT